MDMLGNLSFYVPQKKVGYMSLERHEGLKMSSFSYLIDVFF